MMLSVDEALARVMAAVPANVGERVSLAEAAGRSLVEAVAAPGDLPPWTNSAMDGYAVRAADLPGSLRVLETIAAGGTPTVEVAPGAASRIMTGAPVPAGADAVVMIEDTVLEGAFVRIGVSARPGQHLRTRGSDVRAGDRVLDAGTVLSPGALGMLASLGVPSVRVWARPRVAILSTGDEVVEPGFPLGPGQIHSSNSAALSALVSAAGGMPVDLGNVPDDPGKIGTAFREAARCDLVLSTGGVSVGDFDFVKAVLGGGVEFWRVAMKPGKPLAFGHLDGTPIFGLPGNPVSCMVNFLQFVRPVLRTMLGDPRPYLPVVPATLVGTLRRQPGRPEFLRVRLESAAGHLHAHPAGGHQGSGNVRSMAEAHGFVLVAAEPTEVSGPVRVQVYDWGFMGGATPGYDWAAAAGAPTTGADEPCC